MSFVAGAIVNFSSTVASRNPLCIDRCRAARTGGPRSRFVLLSTQVLVVHSRDDMSANHAIDPGPDCRHDSSAWRCIVRATVDNRTSDFGDESSSAGRPRHTLPMLMTVDEAATLLR